MTSAKGLRKNLNLLLTFHLSFLSFPSFPGTLTSPFKPFFNFVIYFNIFEYNHFFSDFQLPFFSLSMLKLESVGKAKGIMKDQEER